MVRELRYPILVSFVPFLTWACGGERPDHGLPKDDEAVEVRTSSLTPDEQALVQRWAPIHYQDVNKSVANCMQGKGDYMATVNYDGDFNALNNWDNLGSPTSSFLAAMYTTVTESASHYFIYYMSFHPRNCLDSIISGPEHENDAEGAVLLVRKDGTTYGRLEAMITISHGDWLTYTNDSRVTRGPNRDFFINNVVYDDRLHPETYQEPEGHGMSACAVGTTNCGLDGNDSIKYVPSGAQAPSHQVPDETVVQVGYALIDLANIFDRRFDSPTFANQNAFAGGSSHRCGYGGNGCAVNAAGGIWRHNQTHYFQPTPPYSWVPFTADDNNGIGENPAAVFASLYSFTGGLTPPSSSYISNKLLHQKCETGRKMQGSPDLCVQQIMMADPMCRGSQVWSTHCVDQVAAICGKACKTNGVSHCTADICQVQSGPIERGCAGRCAANVCAVDPFCCDTSWDSICVAEVSSVCGLSCPTYWRSNISSAATCSSTSHAMGGFACTGDWCAVLGVGCVDVLWGRVFNPVWDTQTFSEEWPNFRFCPAGKVITGLSSNGDGDNIAIQCSDLVGGTVTTDCDWERDTVGNIKEWSEEHSEPLPSPGFSLPSNWTELSGQLWVQTFDFRRNYIATGARCTGGNCDYMSFHTCRIGPP
jgi:hypothetical protein